MDANDRSRGSGGVLRAIAIPVAVFVAGTGCIATTVALTAAPIPTVRVTAGEETPIVSPDEDDPDPSPEGSGADPGPREPEEPATGREDAGSHTPSVPPESYTGASTTFGSLRILVDICYTDTTITDGMAMQSTAPSGMEYHIYRLLVTNQGDSPTAFDTWGTYALTTEGKEYLNDDEAEFTVASDYYWDEINPDTTVTSYVVFTAPENTEFSEVWIGGTAPLTPN
ncbi:DUF4352 domain-containing protein [Nocardiopsis sp. N85]|uniref:DUF4352 domain-containing protein n=1 Tax=Nocardiopsis sp. N85 TaxID=3029400 RepID=UPI00237FA836|nr:DUF4352 domain-containing protein [Nocardiopsis sp. N85]MDE3720864.1 DUF4352 domain-containing protein [Nocardiopsis sp. N85]